MAEALVSVLLEQLISLVGQQIQQQFTLVRGVEGEVRNLTTNLEAIQVVLEEAERRQVEKPIKRWLGQLKEVYYQIDAVLDRWNTDLLKSSIAGDDEVVRKMKVCFFIPTSCFCLNLVHQVSINSHIAREIKDLNKKLDLVAIQKERYEFVNNNASCSSSNTERAKNERPTTASFVDVSHLLGRHKEKEDLIRELLRGSSNAEDGVDIIPIVGMGGIGKTSFSQLVYNDCEVQKHFQKTIWVYASDPFDEKMVAKAIAEALHAAEAVVLAQMEYQTLLECIEKSIQGKLFLLVLDDVWTDDERKWEPLKESLMKGSAGSKILVTTRKERVAIMMGAKAHMINLDLLSKEVCWSIISQTALLNGDECEKLEQVGREIAEKCKGLPLVAKTLGSLLRFKKHTKEDWESVLHSELWKLEDIKLKVFVPFLLSYYDLPPLEKRCFSFCSYFPKDYLMGRDELIQLWMSQGYLSSTKNYLKIGLECFENLAMRSLFQDFEMDCNENIVKCKMHDIVHDFALFLTEEEFVNKLVDGSENKMDPFNEKAYHYTLLLESGAQIPSSVYRREDMRTLFVRDMCKSTLNADLLSKLTSLRTLTLSGCHFRKLPNKIDELIHLRYLSLHNIDFIQDLPETLCNLLNLQTLKVNECYAFNRLPKGIGKLINLRHLYTYCTNILGYPKGLAGLTQLENLDLFVAHCDDDSMRWIKTDEAMKVEDLHKLKHLKGSMILSWIGNVEDPVEVERARLRDLKHLDHLSAYFYRNKGPRTTEREIELLEALKPNPGLPSFEIVDYYGITAFPSWMSSTTNLKKLSLSYCFNMEFLPPFGTLPLLEYLSFGPSMDKVTKVGSEFLGFVDDKMTQNGDGNGGIIMKREEHSTSFPKLKELKFFSLSNWKEWVDDGDRSTTKIIMPCLSSVQISECDNLQALPSFLREAPLRNITIKKCQILERNCGNVEGAADLVE